MPFCILNQGVVYQVSDLAWIGFPVALTIALTVELTIALTVALTIAFTIAACCS